MLHKMIDSLSLSCKVCKNLGLLLSVLAFSSCFRSSPVNAIYHPSFTEEGELVDSMAYFESSMPSSVQLYVEASGSMNGFFRSNRVTAFKADVWSIFSNFKPLANGIYVFENGRIPRQVSLENFQTYMNQGKFLSAYSTQVPEMVESILSQLNSERGEVAVLVSDMKYSPTGQKDMQVRVSQYASDIRNTVNRYPVSLSLIAAYSQFLDKKGNSICDSSPYYFLVIGKAQYVTRMRNHIATMLSQFGHYAGSIDMGMEYQQPQFTLSKIDNALLLEKQPTLYGIDTEYNDTCSFTIQADVKDYPWGMIDGEAFKKCLKVKMAEGSTCLIDTVTFDVDNTVDKMLKRKATAMIRVKVTDMIADADVMEWSLDIPDQVGLENFLPFMGAQSEDEVNKTYSLEGFLQGCCSVKSNFCGKQPNHILLSKNE